MYNKYLCTYKYTGPAELCDFYLLKCCDLKFQITWEMRKIIEQCQIVPILCNYATLTKNAQLCDICKIMQKQSNYAKKIT